MRISKDRGIKHAGNFLLVLGGAGIVLVRLLLRVVLNRGKPLVITEQSVKGFESIICVLVQPLEIEDWHVCRQWLRRQELL